MFAGQEERITIRFENSLVGVVLDRFGAEIPIIENDAGTFIVHVDACVSPTLLGWLFGFGNKAQVIAPDSLVQQMRRSAEECLRQYS